MAKKKFITSLNIFPRIIWDLAAHLIVSLAGTAVTFAVTGNAGFSLLFFASGIFLDIDHFLDYVICFKRTINASAFFNGLATMSGRVYVFLHSWEIALGILIYAAVSSSAAPLIFGLGYAAHLAIDNAQRKNLLFYIFLYRLAKGFNTEVLLPEYNTEEERELARKAYAVAFAKKSRCRKCKVPLEGFLFRWVASRLLGVKRSTLDAGLCNKCEVKD